MAVGHAYALRSYCDSKDEGRTHAQQPYPERSKMHPKRVERSSLERRKVYRRRTQKESRPYGPRKGPNVSVFVWALKVVYIYIGSVFKLSWIAVKCYLTLLKLA